MSTRSQLVEQAQTWKLRAERAEAVVEAAGQLRAHVATLPEETQRLLNLTGWMAELRNALTRAGKP